MSQTNIHHCHHCGKPTSKTPNPTRAGGISDKVFCDRNCYNLHRRKEWQEGGFTCKCCGVYIARPGNVKSRKFCSMECRSKDAIKRSLTECLVCKVNFSAIAWNKEKDGSLRLVRHTSRKVCSTECHHMFYRIDEERKRKISESERGEKHHNWQGGTHRMGGRGAGWTVIAEKARKRAGYKCEHCGKTQEECGRKLDVNHKIPFHQHPNKTQANRLSNLEALCKSCHMLTEWKWRKANHVQLNLNIFDGH